MTHALKHKTSELERVLVLADDIDISRGDLLADIAHPPRAAKIIESRICWLSDDPLASTARLVLKNTTRSVKAKLISLDHRFDINTLEREAAPGSLVMNDIAQVTIAIAQPIFVDPYEANRATGSFILIDEATNQTVAAGMIDG